MENNSKLSFKPDQQYSAYYPWKKINLCLYVMYNVEQ